MVWTRDIHSEARISKGGLLLELARVAKWGLFTGSGKTFFSGFYCRSEEEIVGPMGLPVTTPLNAHIAVTLNVLLARGHDIAIHNSA